MSTKQTEALKLALEALKKSRDRIVEQGGSGWKLHAQQCVNAITAIREALAEQPVPKTPLTVIVDELQESKNAIATCEALTPEQRHQINKPILEAQIFFMAAARMFAEKDALAEQPAPQVNPETRTKDGLKYSPNYVAGYNDGLKAAQHQEPVSDDDDDVCVDCGMEHCECGEKDD